MKRGSKLKTYRDKNGKWWGKVVDGLFYLRMRGGRFFCSKNYRYLDDLEKLKKERKK